MAFTNITYEAYMTFSNSGLKNSITRM